MTKPPTPQPEDLFRSALYSIGDAVIATDTDARVLHMNAHAEALTGWVESEASGRQIDEVFRIVHEQTRERVENPVARVLREGRIVGLANHTLLVSKNGTERPIADSGAPIRNASGDVVGVVIVFRDQTADRLEQQRMEHRLAMASSVAALSLRLLGSSGQEDDAAIHEALGRIGALTEADRSYVFLFEGTGETMSNTHEACAEGIEPQRHHLQTLPCEVFPWWMRKLQARERIHVPRVALLPPDAAAEKEILEAQSIQSVLVVPLAWEGRLEGFVGFDAVRRAREWTEEELLALDTLANLLSLSFQRKRTADALDRERVQLLSLFHSIDEPVYVADTDTFEILFANQHLEALHGGSLVGQSCYHALQGRTEPCPFCTNEILRARGAQPYRWEHYNEKLGAHFHVIDRLIRWPDGRDVRFELAIDVTQARAAHAALALSEARYRLITTHMADVVLVTDLALQMTYVSPSLQRLCGYESEHVVNQDLGVILLPESLRQVRMVVETTQHDGGATPATLDLEVRCKDGSSVFAEARMSWLGEGAGCDGLVMMLRDVTERKQAREALRASESRFRSLFDQVGDGILVADPVTGELLMANRAMCELMGCGEPELLALQIGDIGPDADADADVAAAWRDAWASNSPTAVHEVTLRRRSQRDLCVDVRVSPVVFTDRPLLVGTFRDVAERRELQASLAQADRLASMGMLAAGVAHEINNPLAYVLYNIQSLVEDLPRLTAVTQRCLNALHDTMEGARRDDIVGADADLVSTSMIEDLLDRAREALDGVHRIREITRGLGTFSRVEQTAKTLVDVRQAMESAVNMAFNEIKYRARLVKDYGRVPAVLATEGKLAQVFLNLLINAAQAIRDGDVDNNRITIRTRAEGDRVVIEVADTGEGIAPENTARIFDPFFTTKGIGVGSGLGLAICRNIVAGFGGTLEVSSRPGEGSCFRVSLPVSDVPFDQRGHRRISSRPPVRGRILIVDDDEGVRTALRRLLGRDHALVTASSGEEACSILETDSRFDLVLCDLMMPRMTGMDLHEWLLKHNPKLARRVVFVTGGAFTPRASEYLEGVENLRVDKPFDGTNLHKLVAELVTSYRNADR